MPTWTAARFTATLGLAVVLALPFAAEAQSTARGPDVVSGAELQTWLDSDGMAVAGINVRNGCYFMAQGSSTRRQQSVKCAGMEPFSVVGEGRVEGNQFCSKFRYPDGALLDVCQDVVRVGDNKYQMRNAGSQPTVIFYRLLP